MDHKLEGKFLFWHIVFYFSIAVLTTWLILKMIGIIQTPFWLQYGIPIASVIVGVCALYQNMFSSIRDLAVGQAILTTKVTHLEKKVDHLDEDVEELKTDMVKMKGTLEYLTKDMVKVKGKLSIA